jgi:hypothetical protein
LLARVGGWNRFPICCRLCCCSRCVVCGRLRVHAGVDDISVQGIDLHARVFGSGWKSDLQLRMNAGGNAETVDKHDAMFVHNAHDGLVCTFSFASSLAACVAWACTRAARRLRLSSCSRTPDVWACGWCRLCCLLRTTLSAARFLPAADAVSLLFLSAACVC